MKLDWHWHAFGETALIWIDYEFENGERVVDNAPFEVLIAVWLPKFGKWALRHQAKGNDSIVTYGEASDRLAAETAILEALPEFVRRLPIDDPKTGKRFPAYAWTIWGKRRLREKSIRTVKPS